MSANGLPHGEAPATPGPLKTQFGQGTFRCIGADPPWLYDDRGSRVSPAGEGCSRPYELMTVEAICELDVGAISTAYAILWLWSTWSHLLDGSAAKVATAWGFTPKQVIPWLKVSSGKSTAKYQHHLAVGTLFGAGLRLQIGVGHYVRPVSRRGRQPATQAQRSACSGLGGEGSDTWPPGPTSRTVVGLRPPGPRQQP